MFFREISQRNNITSKAKPEMPESMRNPFRAKHLNDSMFIEDLVR